MNVVNMQDGRKGGNKGFNQVIDDTHIEGETTLKD